MADSDQNGVESAAFLLSLISQSTSPVSFGQLQLISTDVTSARLLNRLLTTVMETVDDDQETDNNMIAFDIRSSLGATWNVITVAGYSNKPFTYYSVNALKRSFVHLLYEGYSVFAFLTPYQLCDSIE